MTQQAVYSDYLARIKELTSTEPSNDQPLKLIEEFLILQRENPSYENFLKGEKAFYAGQYEQALKYYLKAHELPDFHFFCYRASAYVSHKMGNTPKALFFAKKALRLQPEDNATQQIYKSLLTQNGEKTGSSDIYMEKTQPSGFDRLTSPWEPNQDQFDPLANIPQADATAEYEAWQDTCCNEQKPCQENSIFETSNSWKKEEHPHSSAAPKYDTPKYDAPNRDHSIEDRIQRFQNSQRDWVIEYREKARKNRVLQEDFLVILNGWDTPSSLSDRYSSYETALPKLLEFQQLKKTTGGFYLRWANKGIAVNPGKGFLEKLHKQSLSLYDIDYVIVTKENPECYTDLQAIYSLNYQLNQGEADLHIINYYLNQKAHQNTARFLKPNFKQERNTIHCLDLFQDSPDVEKTSINEDINLYYFPAWSKGLKETGKSDPYSASYGICFELKTQKAGRHNQEAIRIGYVSGAPWSPLLASRLGKCDLLLAGIEQTASQDWSKQQYNADTLGYYGSYTLLEEITPKFLVCMEFNGNEGDNRVEIIRKMRREYAQNSAKQGYNSVILPGDTGLYINLDNFKVRCSFSNTYIEPQNVRIVKMRDAFSCLQYVSPNCLI